MHQIPAVNPSTKPRIPSCFYHEIFIYSFPREGKRITQEYCIIFLISARYIFYFVFLSRKKASGSFFS